MRGPRRDDGPDLASLALVVLILVLTLLALTDSDPRVAALFRLGR
jgi:hypothetical protein